MRFVRLGAAIAVAFFIWAGFGIEARVTLDPARMSFDSGRAYIHPIDLPWPWRTRADGMDRPSESDLRLFEDGRELGPAHVIHAEIREQAGGRFSHWNDSLWFSASDGGDPRANGRVYSVTLTRTLPFWLAWAVGAALTLTFFRPPKRLSVPQWVKWRGGRPRQWPVLALPLALGLAGGLGFGGADGLALWGAAVALVAAIPSALLAAAHVFRPKSDSTPWSAQASVLLAGASVWAVLAMGELAAPSLAAMTRQHSSAMSPDSRGGGAPKPALLGPDAIEAMAARKALEGPTLPPQWASRPVEVAGAARARLWHGVLHVYDRHNMRRTEPIPPKRPGVIRVLVFGDSLTYGDGVEERFTYVHLLGRELAKRGPIEVFGMGVDGDQSTDVLNSMKRHVAALQADIVLYGMCLNDFLPSKAPQYSRREALSPPLPEPVKARLMGGTRLGPLLAEVYDRALRRLHLRYDFYDDILANFGQAQDRFGVEAAEMNRLVTGLGLPPVVMMALNQNPSLGDPGWAIRQIAEAKAREAGMKVIAAEPYLRRHAGRDMQVSPFEGHPNEEAHAIFAEGFLSGLDALGYVPPVK